MQNNFPDWVFFDFFQKLKKEVGIDLSLDQYQHLLRCLFSKPITDVEELRHLLETLWLTKDKYRLEFNRLFDDSIQKYILVNISTPETNLPQEKKGKKDNSEKNNVLDLKVESAMEFANEKGIKEDRQNNSKSKESNSIDDTEKREINISINDWKGKQGMTENGGEVKISGFILSDYKYLPFDIRAIEQSWQKMRGKTKSVITDRLDVKEIVKKRVQKGFVDELIYEKKQKGIQKIMWFSDDASSMAPFEFWEEQLYNITQQVTNTELVERYYFHLYPSERLSYEGKKDYIFFKNRSHSQGRHLSEILKKADKDTIFIIYSDAGAAKKNEDEDLVRIFFGISILMRAKSKKLYWINPVRNYDTDSAKFISLFIPTEYPSNRGINRLLHRQ